MKHIFLSLLAVFFSLHVSAQKDAGYLAGAVPQDANGMVVFSRQIALPQGVDAAKALPVALDYVKKLMSEGIQDLRTKIVSDGVEDGAVVARIEEIMVFKKKPLYLDQANFRYQITARPVDGKLDVTIGQITYYYNDAPEGHFTTYKAEEWIADRVAINKKGTKLYPHSGKFRRKTVDRANAILNGMEDALK